MKTSKVKSVTGNGTFESKYGTLYKFEYTFEDGQVINVNHKTADGAFPIGTLLDYEITNQEYNNGRVSKPQEQSFQGSTKNFDNKGIKIGHAITNAVSIFCSNGNYEAMNMKDSIKAYAKMIYQISEELNNEL